METPEQSLDRLLEQATSDTAAQRVENPEILARIEYICTYPNNRAGVRLLMACMLAKMHQPEIDPRKPYTEIGGPDCFSGRTYDERYITRFINANRLPCNPTTAFLTPALRNINRPLATSVPIVGRPARMYADTLRVLEDVAEGRARAEDVLGDAIRILVTMRDERAQRMEALLASLGRDGDRLPLASEAIVTLIEQHLECKNSSRLPVLVVAAAYRAATGKLGEDALPLKPHTAADEQTGAMGDVEICLTSDERVVTVYEMKAKRVTVDDIDRALEKIASSEHRIDNYVFITTDATDDEVHDYAATLYEKTGGTEIAVLDCVGFLRHFLHLFHRLRTAFLDAYQCLLLAEPNSAVRHSLKEVFLALRKAAECGE